MTLCYLFCTFWTPGLPVLPPSLPISMPEQVGMRDRHRQGPCNVKASQKIEEFVSFLPLPQQD